MKRRATFYIGGVNMSQTVLDAAHATAHDYPGGTRALAVRMALNPAVLSNQLNPNNNDHPLQVRNLMLMMSLTGDMRALHAACLDMGYMALPIPTVADETTTEALVHTCKEFADFIQVVSASLSDGKITKLELRKIRKELGELMGQAGKLEAILAGMEASGHSA
jgi:hypothetical protein